MSNQLSTYVNKALSRTNGLSEVMERQKNQKVQELEELELDAAIAKRKKELQEQLPPPSNVNSVQATNLASTLFTGRTPNEIKEILSTLTQEEIDRLAYIASSTNQNGFANLRGAMQPQNSSLKETIEVIKLILSMQQPQQPVNNGFDMKGIAEIFKAGVEAARVQQQPQPVNAQNDVQYKLVENTLAELKATREQMANQERLKLEKDIETLKNRPSPMEELAQSVEQMQKYQKVFGGDSATANEYTLKKTELEQTERLETKKLEWEMSKWEKEKEADMAKYGIVKTVLEGPVGDVLKSLGNAGAARVRGNAPAGASDQSTQANLPPNTNCPACNNPFYADPLKEQVTCPHCKSILQKATPEQPSTRAQPSIAQPQSLVPSETTIQAEQPAEESGVVGTAH